MGAWWFRMKPRSIAKTIEWFPYFAALKGENWNYTLPDKLDKDGNKICFTRRKYIFNAHTDVAEKYANFEDFASGMYDTVDAESNGRNDKTSFEFYGFGYAEKNGTIKVTEVGKLIVEGRMNDELLLRQLLKIQFPNPLTRSYKGGEVFPMQVVLTAFKHFTELNKFELGFLFCCTDINKIDKTIAAINQFRERYNQLPNKLETNKVKEIFNDILGKTYPDIDNKPETYYSDYADALVRCLQYSGLFMQRGRGLYTKLYVPEHSKVKVKLLQDKYNFVFNNEKNLNAYMDKFGDPYNVILPWQNTENRQIIVDEKVALLKKQIEEAKKKIKNFEGDIVVQKSENLLEYEANITNKILSLNEELFIKYSSKTKEVRDEIIEKFMDIMEGSEDMAALWLEVNTWKSLVAINGEQVLKRNFKLEEDLTPKSFAPGVGNTPDMELFKNGYIILPEVSLMAGVKQWEHEGSSVIDHVFKFIDQYTDKEVYGLFISNKMNIRTLWQFFILNRESWIGKAVPVIPLTIKQYISVITFIYNNDLNIDNFKQLIEIIHKKTFDYKTFKEWEQGIDTFIEEWKLLYEKAS